MTAVPWWASDDPWAMSPEDTAAFAAKLRERWGEIADMPEEPPALRTTHE